jgi:ABC-type molybdenum transport system ATPase subunit/photorepair protein PhrA
VSASFASELRPALIALDVVMTAKNAALETWWHQYDAADAQQAQHCLDRMRIGHLAHRTFGTLSSGEQQRVLLVRSLMNNPSIVLMDEPSARLDLCAVSQRWQGHDSWVNQRMLHCRKFVRVFFNVAASSATRERPLQRLGSVSLNY